MKYRFFALGAVVAASGCSLFSPSSYFVAKCAQCESGAPAVVGDPIVINYSDRWVNDKKEGYVSLLVRCEGVPCTVQASSKAKEDKSERISLSSGSESVYVTPEAPGTLIIRETITDVFGARTQQRGPLKVIGPDRLAILCTATEPSTGTVRPCEAARGGDAIRLELAVYAGERRLRPKFVGDLTLDGTPIELEKLQEGAWTCLESASASDGKGPILACSSGSLEFTPGPHGFTLKRGELTADAKMVITR